jgi:ribose transport system substrate-binding protein
VLLVATAAVALACAACGSSSTTSQGTAQAKSGPDASSAATGVAYAKSQVAKFSQPPTSIGITAPLKYDPVGKLIDFVSCSVPVCTTIGDNIKAAAVHLHMKVNIIQPGTTPASIGSAFDKVVQDHPAALFEMDFPVSAWQKDYEKLCAAHTTMVLNNVDPNTPMPCITYAFTIKNNEYLSEYSAYKLIADSGGNANVVRINVPDLGLQSASGEAAWDATMKKYCPDCTTHVLNVSSKTVGTTLPTTLTAYLRANPEIKYAFAYFGDLYIGVPSALKVAGLNSVKLYSSAGDATEWAYIKSHTQVADLALFWGAYGYQVADIIAREVTHQPYVNPFLPMQWVTHDNINSVNIASNQPPLGYDYETAMAKLWSVAKPWNG